MVHAKDLDVDGKMLLKRGFKKLDWPLCRPTGSSRFVTGTNEIGFLEHWKEISAFLKNSCYFFTRCGAVHILRTRFLRSDILIRLFLIWMSGLINDDRKTC